MVGVRPDLSVVKVRPWLDMDDLRSEIGAALAAIGDEYDLPPAKVQFHWSFRRKAEKKAHALRYFSRPFPGWEGAMKAIYGKRVRRLGLDPDTRSKASRAWREWLKFTPAPREKPPCPCCGVIGSVRALRMYGSSSPALLIFASGSVSLQIRDDHGEWASFLINRNLSTGS